MPTAKSTVHQLMVSDAAMDMMIRAIADLSRRNRRFETLRDVVLHILINAPELPEDALDRFFDLMPLVGQNRVFLRVNQEQAAALEALKDELCAHSTQPCSTREAVCFCCLLIVSGVF